MPPEDFYDLGEKPRQINIQNDPEQTEYPCLHGIDVENFPPLAEMKLGGTGRAEIEFRIGSGMGGIEVIRMKMLGISDAPPKPEPKKDSQKPFDERMGYDNGTAELMGE